MYIGRFAPSPTGPVHFGSFVAGLGGWLDARPAAGKWLVRIEDLDPPRVEPGAADDILATLKALRLDWDEEPVFQSRRTALYRDALLQLKSHTYWCGCSRREVADSALGLAQDGAQIYPGTCRAGIAGGKARRAQRARTSSEAVTFADRVQGGQTQSLEAEVGDFVLLRADGLFAYQLAVVVDDAAQGVTDVVRGADLLGSTARQLWLERLLGYAPPRYLHVPAALNAAGEKLSKQTGAAPIDKDALPRALRFLGQQPSADLAAAVRGWDPARIPKCRTLPAP